MNILNNFVFTGNLMKYPQEGPYEREKSLQQSFKTSDDHCKLEKLYPGQGTAV
jgi:hypothetical protein